MIMMYILINLYTQTMVKLFKTTNNKNGMELILKNKTHAERMTNVFK